MTDEQTLEQQIQCFRQKNLADPSTNHHAQNHRFFGTSPSVPYFQALEMATANNKGV